MVMVVLGVTPFPPPRPASACLVGGSLRERPWRERMRWPMSAQYCDVPAPPVGPLDLSSLFLSTLHRPTKRQGKVSVPPPAGSQETRVGLLCDVVALAQNAEMLMLPVAFCNCILTHEVRGRCSMCPRPSLFSFN